jgi:hypothetical protein
LVVLELGVLVDLLLLRLAGYLLLTDIAAQSVEDNPPAVVVANQPAPPAPEPYYNNDQ